MECYGAVQRAPGAEMPVIVESLPPLAAGTPVPPRVWKRLKPVRRRDNDGLVVRILFRRAMIPVDPLPDLLPHQSCPTGYEGVVVHYILCDDVGKQPKLPHFGNSQGNYFAYSSVEEACAKFYGDLCAQVKIDKAKHELHLQRQASGFYERMAKAREQRDRLHYRKNWEKDGRPPPEWYKPEEDDTADYSDMASHLEPLSDDEDDGFMEYVPQPRVFAPPPPPLSGAPLESVTLKFQDEPPADKDLPPYVEIGVAVRLKDSDLSGSEWRTSVQARYIHAHAIVEKPEKFSFDHVSQDFLDKVNGTPVVQARTLVYSTMTQALTSALRDIEAAQGPWYKQPEYADFSPSDASTFDWKPCMQHGCNKRCDVLYAIKREYQDNGEEYGDSDPERPNGGHRLFCCRHAERGDCSREDCDKNYERVWAREGVEL